jgi:tripartite-type tricarboxylate transporter receptor subunit TctC
MNKNKHLFYYVTAAITLARTAAWRRKRAIIAPQGGVMKKTVLLAATLAVASAATTSAQAQNFPSKSVRIIVPLVPGGNLDLVARAVAAQMGEGLGQQVIVENRPGASSLVGTQFVAKAPADGYTLLAIANTFATVPSLMRNPGYDALKDFAGVSLTCLVPQVLVVTRTLPARTVKDLIALGKAQPGQLAYGSSGAGSTGHIAAELLAMQAGIKMLHIPYKGNAAAIVDVIAGNVQLMFDQVSTSKPYADSGKLRALGVTSLKRSPLFPEVPTIDESGLKGYEEITFNGLVAPAGTPRDVLARLHTEVSRVTRQSELRRRYIERGIELTASATPDEFTTYIKAEFDKKARLAREAGIRIE